MIKPSIMHHAWRGVQNRILSFFTVVGHEIVSKGKLQSLKNAVPDALRWKNASDIEVVLRKKNIYRILYEFQ